LVWVGWAAVGGGPSLTLVEVVFALTLSYAFGLAAVVNQVRCVFLWDRLDKPRPIASLLSLLLVVPLCGLQLFLLWLYFYHDSFR
jgi:hypothetical protein